MNNWILKMFAGKYLKQIVKALDGNKTLTGLVLVVLFTLKHHFPDQSIGQIIQLIIDAIGPLGADSATASALALLVVGLIDKGRKLYSGVKKLTSDKK